MTTHGRGRFSKEKDEDRKEHFSATWARADTDGPIEDGTQPELTRALSEAVFSVENGFALPKSLTKALLVYLRKKDRKRMDLCIFHEVISAVEQGHAASKVSSSGKTAFESAAERFKVGADNIERIYNKVRANQRAEGNPTKKQKP